MIPLQQQLQLLLLLVVWWQIPSGTRAWMVPLSLPAPLLLLSSSSSSFGTRSSTTRRRMICHHQHSTLLLRASVETKPNDMDSRTTELPSSSSSSSSSSFPSFSTTDHGVVVGTLIIVVPQDGRTKTSKYGSNSPVEHPTYYDAATHLAQKTNSFTNNRLQYEIMVLSDDTMNEEDSIVLWQKLCRAEIVIAMGLSSSPELQYMQRVFEARRTVQPNTKRNRLCHWALDCVNDNVISSTISGSPTHAAAQPLPSLVGPYDPQRPTSSLVAQLFPWTAVASGRRLYTQLDDLLSRYTSDDFCYGMVLFLHLFSGNEIDWVKHQTDASWEKGPIQNTKEFYNMLTQCRDCIVPCVQDPQCRECLSKMSQLDPRDQATSYRTLVSYESKLLTNISKCIFTKHNIFQCNAQIPTYPIVSPMTTFRNQPLTEEMGRALLVGHLSNEATALSENLQNNVSWMVACGANVAYDQFPNQHQLFYPAAKGRDMWYDPFFRVVTLDGRNIWCQRHYKVRPGRQPGTFRLSTSDNGVTSDEQWTIIGAADDLSWLVVHYAGAAKAVGLQYTGGLVCTPDGTLSQQDPQSWKTIWNCLQNAGIQPWELTMVDNRLDTPNVLDAGIPPLDYYRGVIQKSRQQQITITPPPIVTTTTTTTPAQSET